MLFAAATDESIHQDYFAKRKIPSTCCTFYRTFYQCYVTVVERNNKSWKRLNPVKLELQDNNTTLEGGGKWVTRGAFLNALRAAQIPLPCCLSR